VVCSVHVYPTHLRLQRPTPGHARPTRRFVVLSLPSAGYPPWPTRGPALPASRRPTQATWDCVQTVFSAPRRLKMTVGLATLPVCRPWLPATARCGVVMRRRSPWQRSREPTCCNCVASSSSSNNNNNTNNYNKTCWCRQPLTLGSEQTGNNYIFSLYIW